MNQGLVLETARQGMTVALAVSLPLLAVALVVGLTVSVFQAVTQIQEQTLTYVPKLVGSCIVLLGMGAWMLSSLVRFTQLCMENAARAVR